MTAWGPVTLQSSSYLTALTQLIYICLCVFMQTYLFSMFSAEFHRAGV